MPSSQVPVPEISKQFDFATKENRRLKQALEENNNFLEQKLQELSELQYLLCQFHDPCSLQTKAIKALVSN